MSIFTNVQIRRMFWLLLYTIIFHFVLCFIYLLPLKKNNFVLDPANTKK